MFILFYSFAFLTLLICSLTKFNPYFSTTTIICLIFALFMMSLFLDDGGDIEKYERIFFGVKYSTIESEQFIGDLIKVVIKTIFNESEIGSMPLDRYENYLFDRNEYNKINHYSFSFYKIFSNLVFILGILSLINFSTDSRKDLSVILVLLVPVTMTFITTAIENAIALGIVFFAVSLIYKNNTQFIFLTIIAGFIHWSSFMFLPLILFKQRLFREISLVFLIFIIFLTFFNINFIEEVFKFIPDNSILEKINIGLNDERGYISPHHIYLSSFLSICVFFFHLAYKNKLSAKERDFSIVILSVLILLLIVSFLFIQADTFIVRISSMMKIIATIYFCTVIKVVSNNQSNLLIILIGFFFSLLGIYSFI